MTSIVRRARPWLGTIVEMRVEGLPEADALRAIDAAFDEVAVIHRLMSFHEPDSDVSRLHRARETRVDARTHNVLAIALRIADASHGLFDPTIAVEQVRRGALPPPRGSDADARADWRDIELLEGCGVRLRRPLWIDLGGIAKGYAVDRTIDILFAAGAEQICVNAGGDLCVRGDRAEPVVVRTSDDVATVLDISNGAVATSTIAEGSHVHGVTREPMRGARTVSVAAPTCAIADALTKVVLADAKTTLMAQFSAQACVHEAASGWRMLDIAA